MSVVWQVAEKKVGFKTAKTHKVKLASDIVDNLARAKAVLGPLMESAPYERLYILALDSSNTILGFYKCSEGTTNKANIYPRNIFGFLWSLNASAVILAHNHPGGSKDPSQEDLNLTKEITKLGKKLGFDVLDHLIFARGECVSMKCEGWI